MLSLSIIIPLYNNERYIENCLRSLFEQDLPYENYEVIVINDGSEDHSREVVLRLQSEFKNLILINQENKGVSSARNIGISSAKGRFLLFIDSDDYVMTNSLGKLIEKADRESLDVLYLSFSVYDNKGSFYGQTDYSYLQGIVFSGLDTYYITRGKKEKDPDRSVGILYRKVFLLNNDLLLLTDMPYLEDGHFVGKVLCLAVRCAFDNTPFYIHLTNPESASNSNLYNTIKARDGFIKAALDLRDFVKVRDLKVQQRSLLNHLVAKYIISSVISSIGSREINTVWELKKQLHQLGFKKLNLNGIIGIKSYAKAYNCSLWVFIFYYFLETRIRVLKNIIIGRKNDDICY